MPLRVAADERPQGGSVRGEINNLAGGQLSDSVRKS
jgi:hypothetical protein